MVTFKKQKVFMAAMKAYNQMEDWNSHQHEKKKALQKMLVQVEQEDVRINKVYWQKIDTQKGVVDYLQSLIESGKCTYEVVNKVSKGVGSN
jgi:hypothetical protein